MPHAYRKAAEGAVGRIKPRVAKHKWFNGGVVFVLEIPKLMSGKIQRKAVIDWSKRDFQAIEGTRIGDGKAKL